MPPDAPNFDDPTTGGGVSLPIAESDVTGLVADLAAKVPKSLFDANTVLAANSDDTPAAVTMGASTILARLAAGNIKAASVAEIMTLLGAAAALVTENIQTASYTLVLGDAGLCVVMNVGSANNLTVPANASVAFPVGTTIEVFQLGAGQTTLVLSGLTSQSPSGKLKLTGQYSSATLRKRATDTWAVAGDLAA